MNDKQTSIKLKLAKARFLMAEVNILMQHHFYITAINRLYYSCFHATKALLLTKDLTPKTHSGVVSMLHQHFVQIDSFDSEQASFFSRLMQERIEDDYSDFTTVDEAAVKEFIEPARKYIAYIEQLIKNSLSNNPD
ncbi:MAG TPA: HEPN domain-containing protein [Puia sp.]